MEIVLNQCVSVENRDLMREDKAKPKLKVEKGAFDQVLSRLLKPEHVERNRIAQAPHRGSRILPKKSL